MKIQADPRDYTVVQKITFNLEPHREAKIAVYNSG